MDEHFLEVRKNFHDLTPDLLFSGGEEIPTAFGPLQALWTSGHSPGHICLYEPGQTNIETLVSEMNSIHSANSLYSRRVTKPSLWKRELSISADAIVWKNSVARLRSCKNPRGRKNESNSRPPAAFKLAKSLIKAIQEILEQILDDETTASEGRKIFFNPFFFFFLLLEISLSVARLELASALAV